MNWVETVVSILSGLVIMVPLVANLVKYITEAVKERNWQKLVNLVLDLMVQAEDKLEEGADRKEWVLAMVKASADSINFDVDIEAVGKLIDDLCAMSKKVNVEVVADAPAEVPEEAAN